MCLAL
ncbi:hypothetical protein MRM62_14910 [bacterium 19CA03SA04]